MIKTKVKMNKPIYLGLSILEISKILMYEFWYDYMKPKYNDNVRLCYMDTDSFVMHIKKMIFIKISLVTLKIGLILQIMKQTDRYQQERIKKSLV